MNTRPFYILPAIVIAQLLGTSTWFAGNAILPMLQQEWSLADSSLGWLTNSVQLGFICGALVFSLLALSDRISPRLLFFLCAAGGAVSNLLIALYASALGEVLLLRFLAGVMLAGIYPVGMKIATGWYPEGLGRALGFLVGALALGTSASHFFSASGFSSWQSVLYAVSSCSLISGLIVLLFVPDGPALHKGKALEMNELWLALKCKPLRAAAGGYFGHMWELYAVWALVPYWFAAWAELHQEEVNEPLWAFVVIAIGGLGCIYGGYLSEQKGSRAVAKLMLTLSGCCCLLSPLVAQLPFYAVLLFWLIWGVSVVADSPQFSALSASTAPPQVVGSALTMINAIGFTITMVAVQLSAELLTAIPTYWLMWLLIPGPVLGVMSLNRLKKLQEQGA